MKTGNLKHPLTVEHGPNSNKPRFATCSETRDRAATARLHIQDVKMGKGTAEEYIVSFQEHEILSKFGDVALVEAFKRGLNSSLLQRIYALPTMPTTLVEWKEWSRKLDRQYREAQIFQKATRPAPANNSNSSRPAAKAQNVPSSSSSPASATTSRSPCQTRTQN